MEPTCKPTEKHLKLNTAIGRILRVEHEVDKLLSDICNNPICERGVIKQKIQHHRYLKF